MSDPGLARSVVPGSANPGALPVMPGPAQAAESGHGDTGEVRAVALSLPRTEEHLIRDWVKFRIGRIVHAAVSPDETIMGFGFPGPPSRR